MKTLEGLHEDKNRIESELKNIISELSRCRINRIKTFSRVIDDLGIDSFTALEILVAVEKRYAIKIPETEIRELSTFGQIVEFVCERVHRRGRKKKVMSNE